MLDVIVVANPQHHIICSAVKWGPTYVKRNFETYNHITVTKEQLYELFEIDRQVMLHSPITQKFYTLTKEDLDIVFKHFVLKFSKSAQSDYARALEYETQEWLCELHELCNIVRALDVLSEAHEEDKIVVYSIEPGTDGPEQGCYSELMNIIAKS